MPKVFCFDVFEVDPAAGQLYKRGLKLNLREKSFQVLAALLERPGEVITRENLRQRLWPDDVFVDFDNNLNAAIATLREVLSDSAKHPRFIETLPKHGYRFLAKVTEAAPAPEPAPAQKIRLVVLPFLNLSGVPEKEYFSDAITDEIITELAQILPDRLAVIARTTAMHYKKSQEDVARIARELNVDYIVEGGVHQFDDRFRITAQLIRTTDQAHVWAQRLEGELNEIFKLEGSIAQAVVEQIGIRAGPARGLAADVSGARARRRLTEDLAAYNEYIQGRYLLARFTPEGFAMAKQHFEKAIARDPNFALAYDSLAEVYGAAGYFGFVRPIDAFSTGIFFAVRALELDNTLAETHALLAQYHTQLDHNWPEAEKEMARALALDPASPVVRARYAFHFLMPHGRLEETVAELEFALELDPLSSYHRTALAITLLLWRRYDRALDEARRILEFDPSAYWGHLAIGSCYRERRMFDQAIAAHRQAVQLSGESATMLGWLGLTLGTAGKHDEARALLARLHEMAAKAYVPPTSLAWIHLGLGERDSAFEWLDRAVDARDQLMRPIKSYAFLDALRGDPRFAALLRKMNLEP